MEFSILKAYCSPGKNLRATAPAGGGSSSPLLLGDTHALQTMQRVDSLLPSWLSVLVRNLLPRARCSGDNPSLVLPARGIWSRAPTPGVSEVGAGSPIALCRACSQQCFHTLRVWRMRAAGGLLLPG